MGYSVSVSLLRRSGAAGSRFARGLAAGFFCLLIYPLKEAERTAFERRFFQGNSGGQKNPALRQAT